METQTQTPTTAESTPTPEPQSSEPVVEATPGTFAEPAAPAQTEPEPQPTEPQSTTAEQEPTEPTEPAEPAPERVVPKPSEYKLPEGIPDNMRIFAHEHQFTQEQLDASIKHFGGYLQGMQQVQSQASRAAGEAHVKNWGAEAKQNLVLAKQAMGWLDSQIEGFSQYLTGSDAGNDPRVLQALLLVGKSMQEGGHLRSAIPRNPAERTAAQSMYGENHPSKG